MYLIIVVAPNRKEINHWIETSIWPFFLNSWYSLGSKIFLLLEFMLQLEIEYSLFWNLAE